MNAQGKELDFWDKVIEKTVNAKIKILLQPSLGTWEIDVKCLQGYKPTKKEDKDSKKNNSADLPPADIFNGKQLFFIYQSQANKKTKAIKKIFTIMVDKDRVEVKTYLQ